VIIVVVNELGSVSTQHANPLLIAICMYSFLS
jgi:hypothetical protein